METGTLAPTTQPTISTDQLLQHWQGHRLLTRKTIEAFPEAQLFQYAIGGMRPFSELVVEMLDMAEGITGIAIGQWKNMDELSHVTGNQPKTKAALLDAWDQATAQINAFWPQVTPQRLQESDVAFGMYEGPVYSTLLYFIDNEIHHRAQGYVYLRSLGIAPPPFWERA